MELAFPKRLAEPWVRLVSRLGIIGMFGPRMTMAVLLASILLVPCWGHASSVILGVTGQDTHNLRSIGPDLSVVSQLATAPPRRAAISRHTPWMSRLKSVLEQTNPQIGEESDLGPAPTPNGPLSLVTIESPARPLDSSHPLRC
jgi:hypothetical protein